MTRSNKPFKGLHYFYLILCLSLMIGLSPKSVLGEEVSVQVTGNGVTREEAISSALMQAVEQVSGVKIESRSSMSVEFQSMSNSAGEAFQIDESQQKEIQKKANGIIKRYEMLESGKENDNRYFANLKVTIERYSALGLPTQDRRRIYTVLPIDLSRKAGSNAALLMDKLNAYLVQSRRFAVLDRGNLGVYEKELDILKSDQVPLAEIVRIGQVIGADYIVIPKIRKFEQTETIETVQLTGQRLARVTTSLNIDYVLVDVATRQIRWTGKIDKKQSSSLEASLLEAVDDLGESILNSIYPLRVLQVLEGGMVVINQGGETLKVNEALTAMQLGEQIIDPYTKEPLGQVETPVAEILIDRVDPKLSYGRVVSGKVSLGDEYILRKSRNNASAHAKQPAASAPKQDKLKW